MNARTKFEVRSFTAPEIIAIEVLGGGANPNTGEEETLGGREWCRSKERL